MESPISTGGGGQLRGAALVSRRPAGAAALRQQAATGLGDSPLVADPSSHLWPPRVVPFALAASAVVGMAGMGIVPLPAAVALDLGAVACYLLALRSVLPRWPLLSGPSWLSGMEPAILPLAALASASLALATNPGLPWTVLTPFWLLLVLTLCPWLDAGDSQGQVPEWGSTVLAALVVTVPIAFFVVVMGAGTPTPLLALGVGMGALIPAFRLIRMEGHPWATAWERSALVAVLMAAAAILVARLQVPGPLLPVAMLMGWYGLTGIAAQRAPRQRGSFMAFVVLAAVVLAIAAPA